MKNLIIVMMLFTGIFHNSPARDFQKEVTGIVKSADNSLPLPQVSVLIKGTTQGVSTDANGKYSITVPNNETVLIFRHLGYITQEVKVGKQSVINVSLKVDEQEMAEIIVKGQMEAEQTRKIWIGAIADQEEMKIDISSQMYMQPENNFSTAYQYPKELSQEDYAEIKENGFNTPWKNPFSTFSIDVDAASYSNVRRFINDGKVPPKDAVKIEEMINYFNYDYKEPRGKHPFAVQHEVSDAPWNTKHKLVHIGIQGEKIEVDKLPPANLVFLVDVSGSMSADNKLPLLKKSLKLLVNQMREEDHVAIVVYAGAAGEVLPSTSGKEKIKIIEALDKLNAGGSTAGGAGIELAYKIAKQNFLKEGNNRVILATDGDFNVGASSNKAMEDLIEEKRNEGVFLTVLGYGMGNYKDSKMELLADKGNGNHAYIDNILEAKKVLVNEFGGTLFTIAKDVKIQVEFNPATVQAYRLIGYENRKLNDEDFNNDKKDAGELGAGHTVTALYEVIPVGVNSQFKPLDDLKYQNNELKQTTGNTTDLMTVKLRYKKPDGDTSILLQQVIKNESVKLTDTSENFRWSAAVAGFGMLLRNSEYKNNLTFNTVIHLAKGAKGQDKEGYRAEFIRLVEMAGLF
ncbi:von Willebrand factor A [Roseivirga seohaensis subsp. aquiponti]|uniref:von Willebrand factor A n=1 Tax=Roseivirga seohaensis subsp. aquiponti TaxID=1566026 RepID=A0A0L8APY6_9BACT|nr:von Willebrand factor type A domain-containing protein [Roseivirga seohaensis]KOF04242.1 von Willebrand factor A [Roseivirga seohaensis subsp. aquiponti]